MPNQSDPVKPQNPSLPTGNPPVVPDFQTADIPPVPEGVIPAATTAPPAATAGSSAPPDTPIISSAPKKKFGGGRIIATILGILVLTGGIIGGVILTQQQQDIRERAQQSSPDCSGDGCTYEEINPGRVAGEGLGQDCNGPCPGEPDSNLHGYYTLPNTCEDYVTFSGCKYYPIDTSGGGGGDDVGGVPGGQNRIDLPACGRCPAGTHPDFSQIASSYCCKTNPFPQYQGTICCNVSLGNNTRNTDGSSCEGGGMAIQQVATCVSDSQPTPPPASGTAQCSGVKAYNASWTALTNTQLSTLKANDIVNFCVAGTTSPAGTGGSFNKAQFKIGSELKGETTIKRPGSNDFCQNYTIKSSDKTVTVKAKIHHTVLGWIGSTN